MENIDIINLWKAQDQKLEKVLEVNKLLLHERLQTKAQNALSGLITMRWVGILFGIVWCLFIGFILAASWSYTNIYFKTSFIIHLVVSVAAIALYIYHLVLLNNFDSNQTILQAQKDLIKLRESNLRTLRLLLVQMPVFTLWYTSDQWRLDSPTTFWFIHIPTLIVMTAIGLWFYFKLDSKNYDKKWFQWFMISGEFAQIASAQKFLEEMEEFGK
jgi:hypothetical protein